MFHLVCPRQVFRPLSNANILIYRLSPQRARPLRIFLFFGEEFLVCPDSGHGFEVCLFVHGRLSHEQNYGFLVGHCPTHSRDAPEVLLQALYPVGGVYHRLYRRMIVQVCEIYLVGRVVATSAYAPVVASPFGTELLPALPGFLRDITAVAGAEHLPQLFGNFSLVAVPHAADDVAFEVSGATLKGGAGEYLAHDIVQTLQAVGAQEAYPFQPSLMQALKNLFPTRCALRWFVAYAQDLARLVFLYGQDDIKGLRLNAVPAVDFDMHAVDEHYGITAF